jgi:threonine/homoserine/homoserine lactone efflux protein
MPWHIVPAFALALLPVVLTPGTSAVLVTQYVTTHGRRHGAVVLAGTATGLYLHACFATLGLSAVVMASATAFTVVRYAGAAYLVGLGVYMLFDSTANRRQRQVRTATRLREVYGQAVVGNVFNPKAALVYLTLPAQFIAPGDSVALSVFTLATMHTLMIVSWLSLWTQLLASLKRTAWFGRFTRGVKQFGGVLLIAMGVRTALSQ